MSDKRFKQFYFFLFFTALMTYLPFIFRFLPMQLLGFNWTGWAWIVMLAVTLYLLATLRRITFPVWTWLPWAAYLMVYVVYDFSFLGLQLTLQYLLPILVGATASGLTYSPEKLKWMFKWFSRLCAGVIVLSFFYLSTRGFVPASAATPMMLSVAVSLVVGLYFLTREIRYLIFFGLLFLEPVIDVTRMAIASFLAIFVLHFANNRIGGKLIYGLVGLLLVVAVFNTQGFQEKTFGERKGKLSDLSVNYYDNENINTNGRSSWRMALEPGLKARPTWGNGPRADNVKLKEITGLDAGEAHDDYLAVRYNYGNAGLGLLLFGFCSSFLVLYRVMKQMPNVWGHLVATSALTLYFSFLMFMYSDNILKYTIYFPNLFFAMMGIVYSIRNGGWEEREK